MPLPEMTSEQRTAALRKAREARATRASALGRLRAGQVTLPEILDSDDEVIRKTRVRSVLLALPGVGPAKASAIMTTVAIDPKRRVGGLGDRQRKELGEQLAA